MIKAPQPEAITTASRHNPGETLRQEREQKGLSLAQVAEQLNLTENSLRQLESGAFDQLPGHTFSRGYIRAYAKLMGLDQNELVHSFDLYTGTDASGSIVQSLGHIAEPVHLVRNVLRFVSLLPLALLVGFGYFWWQEHSIRGGETAGLSLEHVEVESADGTTEIHTLDEPEDQAVAEAEKGDQVLAEVSPEVAAQTEGIPAVPAEILPGPADIFTSVQPDGNVQQPTASSTAPAGDITVESAPNDNTSALVPTAPMAFGEHGVVKVQFIANCWTEITDATGKVLVRSLKREGDSLELTGKAPLELRLGFARGAQVNYNGQLVDITPFVQGETARVKLGQ